MLESITNFEDNTRANYAIDYLPAYSELRFELIRTYQLAEREDTLACPSWMATLSLVLAKCRVTVAE